MKKSGSKKSGRSKKNSNIQRSAITRMSLADWMKMSALNKVRPGDRNTKYAAKFDVRYHNIAKHWRSNLKNPTTNKAMSYKASYKMVTLWDHHVNKVKNQYFLTTTEFADAVAKGQQIKKMIMHNNGVIFEEEPSKKHSKKLSMLSASSLSF